MRSRSAGVASIGTRSLSWRFTPHAPTSASSATASTGGSGSRTASPNGSRPRLPTVQRPNENLCSGRGAYRSVMRSPHPAPRTSHVAPRTAQCRIEPSICVGTARASAPTTSGRGRAIAPPRTRASHAASTVGQRPMPTTARIAAPYAAPSSAVAVSTGVPEHVGLDLTPERRSRSAAAKADASDRHAHLGEDRERIAQAERDAFQDRAHDVPAAMARRQTDQRGAGIRIAVRRAFAHQVRRPEEAVGARWHGCGFSGELVVRDAGCRADRGTIGARGRRPA